MGEIQAPMSTMTPAPASGRARHGTFLPSLSLPFARGIRNMACAIMHIYWRCSSAFCLSPDLQQYNCLDRHSTGPVSLAWHFGLDTPIAKTRGRWRLLLSQQLPFLCLSQVTISQDSRCFLSTSPPQLMGICMVNQQPNRAILLEPS